MKKIKIIGFVILLILLTLIYIFNTISTKEQQYNAEVSRLNTQKSYTQEIAKTIFFTHRHKKEIPKSIDKNMYDFLSNLKTEGDQDQNISRLSHEFFELVNQFKYIYNGNVPYNIIILDKLTNNIYKKNMDLVVAFNQSIEDAKNKYSKISKYYHLIQYILFAALIALLIYIFTQVDEIIKFIQLFTRTSDRIIKKSTIKGLEPIEATSQNRDIVTAQSNFNLLVEKIDDSIRAAGDSIENSIEALAIVEKNIELLIALISQMQDRQKDSIYKKEDAIIESLDNLMALSKSLKDINKKVKDLLK